MYNLPQVLRVHHGRCEGSAWCWLREMAVYASLRIDWLRKQPDCDAVCRLTGLILGLRPWEQMDFFQISQRELSEPQGL